MNVSKLHPVPPLLWPAQRGRPVVGVLVLAATLVGPALAGAAGCRLADSEARICAGEVVEHIGTDPHQLVLGFMAASAFLSMWISDSAAVVIMLPVVMLVVAAAE